jgi:hypothetical protein
MPASTLRLQPITSNSFPENRVNYRHGKLGFPDQPRPGAAVHRPRPPRDPGRAENSPDAGQASRWGGNAVPDPRAESPHAGPPSRGFHVPPATAFLTRPPGTTSTDLGRPDRTDLRDRDEQADRSDASLRRIGARPPGSPAASRGDPSTDTSARPERIRAGREVAGLSRSSAQIIHSRVPPPATRSTGDWSDACARRQC